MARTTAIARTARPRRFHLSALQVIVHAGAWIPLILLVYAALTDNLTINPIQAAEQRTGDTAIALLILSLACTPINTLMRFPPIIRVRRALGLYGYMYAAIHLSIFIGVDYAFDPRQLIQALQEKPYIIVGTLAFVLLTLLAITSFRRWKARLGKNWKRLHQLIYLINLLVVLHFSLSVKGDLLRLMGDIARPLAAGLIILILLLLRLPAVRRSIAGQRRGDRRANLPIDQKPGAYKPAANMPAQDRAAANSSEQTPLHPPTPD